MFRFKQLKNKEKKVEVPITLKKWPGKDPLKHITGFVSDKDATNLAASCQFLRQQTNAFMPERKCAALASYILVNPTLENKAKVIAELTADRKLLFTKIPQAKNKKGQIIKNRTLFQLAYGERDDDFCEAMKQVFIKHCGSEQAAIVEMRRQRAEVLHLTQEERRKREEVRMRFKQLLQDVVTAITVVRNVWKEAGEVKWDFDQLTRAAIKEFRQEFAKIQPKIIESGMHFDESVLEETYKVYACARSLWRDDWSRYRLFEAAVLSTVQAAAPVNVQQKLSQGITLADNEQFQRSLTLSAPESKQTQFDEVVSGPSESFSDLQGNSIGTNSLDQILFMLSASQLKLAELMQAVKPKASFSSYFKNPTEAKPSFLMRYANQHAMRNTLEQLPNGLLLSGGVTSDDSVAYLELYDPNKKTQVATRRLAHGGSLRFLSLSKERVLIMSKEGFDHRIDIIDATTLNCDAKLEKQFREGKNSDLGGGIYLEEQQVATVCQDAKNTDMFAIWKHDVSKMTSELACQMERPNVLLDHGDVAIYDLQKIANDLFACKMTGDKVFQILLFRKSGNQFTHINTLNAKADSRRHGRFVGLADGNILSYHESGASFQVWNEDGECIDTWSWKDVACHDKVFKQGFDLDEVRSLPDGEHLLMLSKGKKLFLFNMKTRVMNAVDFGDPKLKPMSVKVLANGQVAVHVGVGYGRPLKLVCFDFEEMRKYRRGVTEELYSAGIKSLNVDGLVTSYLADAVDWSPAEMKRPGKR